MGGFVDGGIIREKKASKLSDSELEKRAKSAPHKAGERDVVTRQFERSPYVVQHAKRRAKGICELCKAPAPFINAKGEPYLETHHIIWLASGGDDTIANTVALCPNCHRRMHALNSPDDRKKLNDVIK